jgi:hypothetical protein
MVMLPEAADKVCGLLRQKICEDRCRNGDAFIDTAIEPQWNLVVPAPIEQQSALGGVCDRRQYLLGLLYAVLGDVAQIVAVNTSHDEAHSSFSLPRRAIFQLPAACAGASAVGSLAERYQL